MTLMNDYLNNRETFLLSLNSVKGVNLLPKELYDLSRDCISSIEKALQWSQGIRGDY